MKFSNLIILIVIWLLGFFLMVQMHEVVHKQIFRSYGIDSYISWTEKFPDVITRPEEPCPNDFCTLAHDINEVVGYTLEGFYIGVGSLMIFLRISLDGGVK